MQLRGLWTPRTTAVAAVSGQLEVLKYIRTQEMSKRLWAPSLLNCAILSGRLPVIEWFLAEGFTLSRETEYRTLAALGRVDLLERFLPTESSKSPLRLLPLDITDSAAAAGQMEAVKWLQKRRYNATANGCMNTLLNGHIEMARYLDPDFIRTEWAIREALSHSNTVLVKMVDENQLHVLDWLIQRGLVTYSGIKVVALAHSNSETLE